MTLHILR